jgi:predicted RNase H-like nuclease (RuvC/YqgF family)
VTTFQNFSKMKALTALQEEVAEHKAIVMKLKAENKATCNGQQKDESAKKNIIAGLASQCKEREKEVDQLKKENDDARKIAKTLKGSLELVHATTAEIQDAFGMAPPKAMEEGTPGTLQRLGKVPPSLMPYPPPSFSSYAFSPF